MVGTQRAVAPGQGVLVECAGLLIFAQRAQVGREPVGRGEGIGVAVAQYPAKAGKGVVLELAGLLVLAQRPQGQAEVAGCAQGVGMVGTLYPAEAGKGVVLEIGAMLETCGSAGLGVPSR